MLYTNDAHAAFHNALVLMACALCLLCGAYAYFAERAKVPYVSPEYLIARDTHER